MVDPIAAHGGEGRICCDGLQVVVSQVRAHTHGWRDPSVDADGCATRRARNNARHFA